MKIRSITAFLPSARDDSVAHAGHGLRRAREAFQAAGFEVQTVRAALPPLGELEWSATEMPSRGTALERHCIEAGIDYVSVGPWRVGDLSEQLDAIPDLIDATEALFATVRVDRDSRIDLTAIRGAANCIVRNAPLREHGFGNLRFSMLANVPAGVPFLPAAYSDGHGFSFALALESADLARDAFAECESLDAGADRLTAAVQRKAAALEDVARSLELDWRYAGADFSLATFPGERDSIGLTIESMGVSAVGLPGTTTAAAVLTGAVQRANFRRAGFNGLFLPVLEDSRLARRAAEGSLRLEDLLLASTVCGTGLDTVPLPGDVRADELLPYLLDLSALAIRLDKPLTARLMPMPGCRAGDPLDFDFPFFSSGKVMDLRRAAGLVQLAGTESVLIRTRESS